MKKLVKIPLIIALVCLGVIVFSGAVMLLWNAVMPAVFHLAVITFGQAMCLLLLSKILFSGFRGRRVMGGWQWRKKMFGKWQQMTAEEREMFASRMGCRDFAPGC